MSNVLIHIVAGWETARMAQIYAWEKARKMSELHGPA